MTITYKQITATLFMFAVIGLFPVFAQAEVDKEIAEVTESTAAEAIDQATVLVAEAAVFVEEEATDKKNYLEYAEEYLANAESAFAKDDFGGANDWANKAIGKSEWILGQSSEDKKETKVEEKKTDYVEKKEKDYVKTEDKKYADYGKSDDIAELQAQMRELLQLMIQLLTLQMAQQL